MPDGMEPPPNAHDEAGPGLGICAIAAQDQVSTQAAYRVLARKYRPARFEDLIGQDAMVKTLSNAFDLERIHQAYILTGVRGVGKTTTARLLARAFNYEVPARGAEPAVTRPTIHMPGLGVHCQAIIESRHVDVIEMDAASHTGIDDVREIIESVRYLPVMARTKVYIIDEVHMLSKQAFNGLLKTLEEPPDHVKFVFATTEIEKVPVTVRSRCQRFDLRRVDAGVLTGYLASICAKEAVAIEDAALSLIARAAEGSVRDALSLLDQAIAHGAGLPGATITAEALHGMLGLADRGRIVDLFEALMRGQMAEALGTLKEMHDFGADPSEALAGLAEFIHLVTRLKLVPDAAQDSSLTPEERTRGQRFSQELSMQVLTRAWQLLLKGLREVKDSPRPLAAADMVLVRIGFAADLPAPDEAVRKLAAMTSAEAQEGSRRRDTGSGAREPAAIASSTFGVAPAPRVNAAAPSMALARFEDVVALAGRRRDIQMKLALERDVRLVGFEQGRIEFSTAPGASPQLAQTLARRLQEWTGSRWMVAISSAPGAPSLKEQEDAKAAEALSGVRAEPLVQSVLAAFPGAEIASVRACEPPPRTMPSAATDGETNDEIGFNDGREDEL
ncbi:MAG: DNA polymerase III subunit gamma/tau [Methylocella sp.]|nr:MAG: DNA polymerase III subunit gamma/tau [Hyphomicrobiales bacterium]